MILNRLLNKNHEQGDLKTLNGFTREPLITIDEN
jgi:hypothetical protein